MMISISHWRKALRFVLPLTAAVLVAVGIIALSFSFLSFSNARGAADWLSNDHEAEAFTPELFEQRAAMLARVAGAILAASGLAIFRWRGVLAGYLEKLLSAMGAELRSLGSYTFDHWQRLSVTQKVLLFCVFASGVAMRLVYITQPIRYDEASSYLEYASQPLVYLFYRYVPNNHMLHTILMKAAIWPLGGAEWVIRMPAFVAGCLGLAAVYLLCVRLATDNEGTGAGLITLAYAAVDPHGILYSTNGRGYTLAFLLWCGVLAACLELRNRPSTSRTGLWAWIVVLSTLMLWTVPSMLYAFAGSLIAAVVFAGGALRLQEAVVPTLVTGVLTVILYLPVMALSGWRALFANPWVTQTIRNPDIAQGTGGLIVQLYSLWTEGWPLAMPVLLGVGIAAGVLWKSRVVYLWAIAFVTSLFLAKIQGVTPPGRVFFYLLPLTLAAGGSGLASLLMRNSLVPKMEASSLLAVGFVLFGGLGVYGSRVVTDSKETGANPEAEAAARFIQPHLREGDRVVATMGVLYPLLYWMSRLKIPMSFASLHLGQQPARYVLVMDKQPPGMTAGASIQELAERAVRDNYPAVVPIEQYRLGEPVFDRARTVIVFGTRK